VKKSKRDFPFKQFQDKDGKTIPLFGVYFESWRGFSFKNYPPGQRLARCKICNIPIPREVPRFFLNESWSWRKGHYCIKCAHRMLVDKKESLEKKVRELKGVIKKIEEMIDLTEKVMNTKEYRKRMAVAHMCKAIERKRSW